MSLNLNGTVVMLNPVFPQLHKVNNLIKCFLTFATTVAER